MLSSEIPNNSFYKWDKIEIYKNKNGVLFLAMKGEAAKRAMEMPIDVEVIESNKESFIENLKGCDVSSAMSHLIQEGLLKELA